jgi:hypothetical protein
MDKYSADVWFGLIDTLVVLPLLANTFPSLAFE